MVEIGATWAPTIGAATNAPFQVYDAAGQPLWADPVRLNQRVAPNDFEDAGVMWEKLGTAELAGNARRVALEQFDRDLLATRMRLAMLKVAKRSESDD